ncbi:MAG: hypothetical protein OEV14_07715 [Gammaproteobacteria bacterium]|nr:hypothetical protein [Gammaproteobacteria bacterium]
MASSTDPAPATRYSSQGSPQGSKLWRAPFVGIFSLVAMLLGIGLAHAVMRAIEEALGHDLTYIVQLFIGAGAIVWLWYGVKSRNENFATWTGFFTGIVIWMTWVELFFMYYGRKNFGMMPRVDGGAVTTEPEYLIMTATTGVLMFMLVFYVFDKDTRCNFFIWFQNRLGLRDGLGPSTRTARDRNYAIITFMETIYVTWFCYAWNLLVFDPTFVGYGRDALPAEVATVFVSITWGGYCLNRLLKYRRTSTAVRYGIPTANILWISVEIVSGWGLMTEIWLYPKQYWLELLGLTAAFTLLTVLIYKAPKKTSEIGEW